jgi:aquaporin Z
MYNYLYKVDKRRDYPIMATKKASTKKKTTTVTKKVVSSSSSNSASDLVANAPVGALFGELIGTFLLASIVIATQGQPIFVLFALTAIVLTVGNLSGAHVNPAITFGAWATKKIPTAKAVGYIIFQVLGAMLAFAALNALLGGEAPVANQLTGQAQKPELFSATQLTDGKEWYAFWASLLGTAVFGFAVAGALREKKERFAAAYTVGGGLFLGLIIAGSTAILNPAVAVALQAFTNLKGDSALWYAVLAQVIAPLIGSAIGFLLYDYLRRDVDGK